MSVSKYGRALSVREAAAYLGLSETQLYYLADHKRIACVRSDGRILERRQGERQIRYRKSGRLMFFECDLEAWIEAHRTPAKVTVPHPTPASDRESVDARMAAAMPKERRFA